MRSFLTSQFVQQKFHMKSPNRERIVDSDDKAWTLVGDARNLIHKELYNLYWTGVRRELKDVLLTLKTWQAHDGTVLPEEFDNFVHGFDAFVDQLSEERHKLAQRIHKDETRNGMPGNKKASEPQENMEGSGANYPNMQLKDAIRQGIPSQKGRSITFRRAKMLLQAVGLLDAEKLVEHRPHSSTLKVPAIPQLELAKYRKDGMPILKPLRCSTCQQIIYGNTYEQQLGKEIPDPNAPLKRLCEACYGENFLGKPEYSKSYKHSVLDSVISPAISRKICLCDDVPHFDEDGQGKSLFPIQKDSGHRTAENFGQVECGLLRLGEVAAEAKYNGMQTMKFSSKKSEQYQGRTLVDERRRATKNNGGMVLEDKKEQISNRKQNQQTRKGKSGSVSPGLKEFSESENESAYLSRYSEKTAPENRHMALRFGPLVIEKGVVLSKEGFLITMRDDIVLHSRRARDSTKCLAVTMPEMRQLWSRNKVTGKPRRFRLIMKQVVGSPFTGILEEKLEEMIINRLVAASKVDFKESGEISRNEDEVIDQLLDPIVKDMKDLFGGIANLHVGNIASTMSNWTEPTKGNPARKNFQYFCDELIAHVRGPVSTTHGSSDLPLFLMSFAGSAPTGTRANEVKSKFDVPEGLVEEYLRQFREGTYNDSDLIDSLQEYWHDWGCFPRPLYKYQTLFPWDCTEAFRGSSGTCGDCNLAKHIWAFPYDAWSIISMHLTRDWHDYPRGDGFNTTVGWMKNRLLVLSAQEKLILGAAAMAKTPDFHKEVAWLTNKHSSRSAEMENPNRLKLGGIHRAQPFSHAYDRGKYHEEFVAPWAVLHLEDRVAEYEALRNARAQLPDMKDAQMLRDGEDIEDILKRIKRGQ